MGKQSLSWGMGKQAGCRVDPAEGQLQGFKAAGREAGATGLRTRMSGLTLRKKTGARQQPSVWGLRNSWIGVHNRKRNPGTEPEGEAEPHSRNQEGSSY